MYDSFAISLRKVFKTYNLYGRQSDQLIDVLGLSRIGLKPRTPPRQFPALTDINLEVPRGGRVGIVGRNGAGKTTLLKLICGNFTPTSGEVEVNGTVQALLTSGSGFHPDFTGRENVHASLQYNGLRRDQYDEAVAEIEEFCELEYFFDQPFKTYSAGMQARLMFATATAVKPDILIVDEVLGAGDAYFIAKSKRRVETMVTSGCSMLLVSHSMAQVLELCQKAIWMDQGKVRMEGESFEVVKAYEEYLHGRIQAASFNGIDEITSDDTGKSAENVDADLSEEGEEFLDKRKLKQEAQTLLSAETQVVYDTMQEPRFWPNMQEVKLPACKPPTDFSFVTKGGVSRWDRTPGLKIIGFSIVTEHGITNQLISMRPVKFLMTVETEIDGDFDCRYAVDVYDHMGRNKIAIVSTKDSFKCEKGEHRSIEMLLNPVQLGPGEFTVSISAHEYDELELFNSTPRYDLLSRSFEFSVDIQDSLRVIETEFYHTAQWQFSANKD